MVRWRRRKHFWRIEHLNDGLRIDVPEGVGFDAVLAILKAM